VRRICRSSSATCAGADVAGSAATAAVANPPLLRGAAVSGQHGKSVVNMRQRPNVPRRQWQRQQHAIRRIRLPVSQTGNVAIDVAGAGKSPSPPSRCRLLAPLFLCIIVGEDASFSRGTVTSSSRLFCPPVNATS